MAFLISLDAIPLVNFDSILISSILLNPFHRYWSIIGAVELATEKGKSPKRTPHHGFVLVNLGFDSKGCEHPRRQENLLRRQ